MKSAAVYNRWLANFGGGEQVTFAYAEALRDLGYKTTLLTHKQVNLFAAEKKMNVDLSKIEVRYLPQLSSKELSRISKQYDLFINSSHLDYFRNLSNNGFLSVFFPEKMNIGFLEFCKRAIIVPMLRRFFIFPSLIEGFESIDIVESDHMDVRQEKSTIYFSNNDSKKITIQISCSSSLPSTKILSFEINGKKAIPHSELHNPNNHTITCKFQSPMAIHSFSLSKLKKNDQFNLRLTEFEIPNIRFLFYLEFKKFFPKWELRLHGGPSLIHPEDLKSYKKIITISKFCQKWIKNYWNLPSEVLYPPVNITAFHPAPVKNNWISHIGRFFVTGHSKKQLDLIRVFKELIDQNKIDKSWEFHLVGSIHEGEIHRNYFNSCIEEAKNYPIFFHVGVPFKELQSILSKTKIYWHATGLDSNPDVHPIRMEHFGITTVEAMASGCVPIVINSGGQPEIVQPETGYLWKSRDELKQFTVLIANNDEHRKKMMKKAVQRSKDFSVQAFRKCFLEIIKNMPKSSKD